MAAVATAIFGAGSSLLGIRQSRKAAKAAQDAAQARASIARLENARERRAQVRQFRIERGSVLAQQATRGGGGGFGGVASSSSRGQTVGLRSQLRSNLDFIDRADELSTTASAAEIRAVGAQGRAATFAGISAAAFNVGSLFAVERPPTSL